MRLEVVTSDGASPEGWYPSVRAVGDGGGNGPVRSRQVDADQVSIAVSHCYVDERLAESALGGEASKWPCNGQGIGGTGVGWEVTGRVVGVGDAVRRFRVGDQVLAVLEPGEDDAGACSGSSTVAVAESACVTRPHRVSATVALAMLKPALLAYSAVHYKMHLEAGESLLVTQPRSSESWVATQLATQRGAFCVLLAHGVDEFEELNDRWGDCASCKVILVPDRPVSSSDNRKGKDAETQSDAIAMSSWSEQVCRTLLDETDGLGFDHIFDSRYYGMSKTQSQGGPYSNEAVVERGVWTRVLIQCLGPHASLVVRNYSLELNPEESLALGLRGSSIAFISEYPWLLSPSKRSRMLHILEDMLLKLEKGILEAPPVQELTLESAPTILTQQLRTKRQIWEPAIIQIM